MCWYSVSMSSHISHTQTHIMHIPPRRFLEQWSTRRSVWRQPCLLRINFSIRFSHTHKHKQVYLSQNFFSEKCTKTKSFGAIQSVTLHTLPGIRCRQKEHVRKPCITSLPYCTLPAPFRQEPDSYKAFAVSLAVQLSRDGKKSVFEHWNICLHKTPRSCEKKTKTKSTECI